MTDIRQFKDVDGNDLELNRRRVIAADLMKNYDLDQDGDGPRIMVRYKPNVWSADEGDEPSATCVDIRADAADFSAWWGQTIGTMDFASRMNETVTIGGIDYTETDAQARRIMDHLAGQGHLREDRNLPSIRELVNLVLKAQLELNAEKAANEPRH
jgi:hypothetical protein